MHPVPRGRCALMRAFVRSFFVIAANDLVGEKSRWLFVGECWVPVRVHPMPLVHEVTMRAHVGAFVGIDAMNASRLWRGWKIVLSWGNFPILEMSEVVTDFDRYVPFQARSSQIEVSAGTKRNSTFLTVSGIR
jgi:hypothetical protein